MIGSPIRHSLSPVIFNAAFGAAGLDWAYLAFDVPEGAAGLAMGGMRALGLEGLSVTMPHKAAVREGLDALSADAEALGAVNCITRRGVAPPRRQHRRRRASSMPSRSTRGSTVSGTPLRRRRSGRRGPGRGPGPRRAPGAAVRGHRQPVARAGRAERGARRPRRPGRVGRATSATADLVVNATPLGMGVVVTTAGEPEPLPVDLDQLGAGQVVVDLVYHPAVTPLLAAARERGLRTVNGLGMLIHQAAHAFRLWTGEDPPLEAMSAAAVGLSLGSPPGAQKSTEVPVADLPMGTTTHSPPEAIVALQGTLDTFALPDVLRLLAATKKTGRLRITGGRGTGSVWVSSGEVEAIEATHAPHASEAVDALFELLRFEEGAFTFDAEARHDEPGPPTDVEILLAHSEAMLAEWREIEAVVPSMDAWVTLRRTLPLPEIAVDQACWTTIVAIGAGATVRRIGDELCLAELPISRAVKELSEAGLIEIAAAAPAGALPSTNGHAPLARPLVAAKAKELREPEVPPPPAAAPRPRRAEGDR